MKGGVQIIPIYNPKKTWSPLDLPQNVELKNPRPPTAPMPRAPFGSPLARRIATPEERARLLNIKATKKQILDKYQIVLSEPIYSVVPPQKVIKVYSHGQVSLKQTIIPPNSEEWLYECAMRIKEAINLEDNVGELKARVEHLKALSDVHETSFTKHHWY
jgi:hypothetical protein